MENSYNQIAKKTRLLTKELKAITNPFAQNNQVVDQLTIQIKENLTKLKSIDASIGIFS